MARPKVDIDADQLYRLAAIHCTVDEMASVLGVHKRTLERRFASVIDDGRNHGKMSLRRKQYEIAMEGNVQMLQFLGRQYLGQSDSPRVELKVQSVAATSQIDIKTVPTSELIKLVNGTQQLEKAK